MLPSRVIPCLAIGVISLFAFRSPAQSPAPPPFGMWVPKPAREHLSVTPTWCKFDGNNGQSSVLIEGKCSWDDPTAAGAILTIINVHAYEPAPVRFSIVWVNSKAITVNGETFYKQE